MVTLKLVEILDVWHEGLQANKMMHKFLMPPVRPVLISFPFNEFDPSVEIHSFFREAPRHVFSPGISKIVKECLINMLEDDQRTDL